MVLDPPLLLPHPYLLLYLNSVGQGMVSLWVRAWSVCGSGHGQFVGQGMVSLWVRAWSVCGSVHGPFVVIRVLQQGKGYGDLRVTPWAFLGREAFLSGEGGRGRRGGGGEAAWFFNVPATCEAYISH